MRLVCLRGEHEVEIHTDDDRIDGHCYEHHSDLVPVEEYREIVGKNPHEPNTL